VVRSCAHRFQFNAFRDGIALGPKRLEKADDADPKIKSNGILRKKGQILGNQNLSKVFFSLLGQLKIPIMPRPPTDH